MNETPEKDTRERILDAADELFSQRGFASVKLRDIAAKVGMRHASLYYHVPGGKEQLFIEVMERNLRRHRDGLVRAVEGVPGDLRAQMRAVARWLASQPPLDLARMLHADMPAIPEAEAERLMWLAFTSLSAPIVSAVREAGAAVNIPDAEFAAMSLVALAQSVHAIPERFLTEPREAVAERAVDMLLDGWRAR